MRAIFGLLLVLLVACDKPARERTRDDSARATSEPSAEVASGPSATAPPPPSASVAATSSGSLTEEDTPEIADASGAAPAPSAADDVFKDVQIPVGVTIPTEEDYEEQAEREITAANFESELAKIEKQLAP